MPVTYDSIIIGAGLSGVTAAIILAKNGQRVALVEAGRQVLPTIRGFRRKGSFLDTGFHYVGGLDDGDVLDRLFDYIGIKSRIQKVPMSSDGYDVYYCRETERRFAFVSGWERLAEHMKSAFPMARCGVDKYLADVRKIYHEQPRDLLRGRISEDHLFRNMEGKSLIEYLSELTDDPDLPQALAAHCLLYGVQASDVSFPFHGLIAGSYYESAYTIFGGGEQLAAALEASLAEHEIDVMTGRPVSRCLFSDTGLLTGVELSDGECIMGRHGISTVHPRTLLAMVPESVFRPVFLKRLRNLRDTSSAFILYGRCKQPAATLRGSNFLLFEQPPMANNMETMGVEQRPMFVASGAPGHYKDTNITVICPESFDRVRPWADSRLGDRPQAYLDYKDQMIELLRKRLADFPELNCADLEPVAASSPLTLRDYMHTPSGCLYGVKHCHGDVDLAPRTRARNFFLSGQNIMSPGLMGAMLSAVLTSGFMVGFDEIKRGFE